MSDITDVIAGWNISPHEAYDLVQFKKDKMIRAVKRFDVGDDFAVFAEEMAELIQRTEELCAFAGSEIEAHDGGGEGRCTSN